jgi:hypothetical protein
MHKPTLLMAHLQTAQADTQTKVCKRATKANPKKIVFKKFPTLKKIKNATHSRHSMTRQLNSDNGLQARWTETPAPNSGLAKVAVQCSADNFVVTESSVLRINICGKNRHLRQAAKR